MGDSGTLCCGHNTFLSSRSSLMKGMSSAWQSPEPTAGLCTGKGLQGPPVLNRSRSNLQSTATPNCKEFCEWSLAGQL